MQYRKKPLATPPAVEACIHTQAEWASCLQREYRRRPGNKWTRPRQPSRAVVNFNWQGGVHKQPRQAMHLCSRNGGQYRADSVGLRAATAAAPNPVSGASVQATEQASLSAAQVKGPLI